MTTKFPPLVSGNPNGRPVGTQSRKTIAAEARALLTATMRDQALSLDVRVQAAGALVSNEIKADGNG